MASVRTSTARPSTSSGIVDALNHEWLGFDRDQAGTVRSWAGRHEVFARCRSVDDVLDVVRRPVTADTALHALLAEAAAGEQLAGRVVLQSMIGRMVQMAHRDVRAGVDDYVAALWCEIRTYPLALRPVRIAANLALDTLKSVHRDHRWLVRGEVTTWPPGELLDELCHLAGERASSGTGGVAGAEAEAQAVIATGRTLELIDEAAGSILTSVYLEGLTGAEAAERHHTSAGSIRVRCSRAVGRLAGAAGVLAEAA